MLLLLKLMKAGDISCALSDSFIQSILLILPHWTLSAMHQGKELLLSPFYGWANQGTKKDRHLSKVAQLVKCGLIQEAQRTYPKKELGVGNVNTRPVGTLPLQAAGTSEIVEARYLTAWRASGRILDFIWRALCYHQVNFSRWLWGELQKSDTGWSMPLFF